MDTFEKHLYKELKKHIVHPGGLFWAKKDLNSWSIPKGEFTEDENPFDAAKREFEETVGLENSSPLAS